MEKLKILIVDDENLLRQGVRSLLENEKFVDTIYEAGDAKAFYQQLAENAIDIILLDIKLTSINGQELIIELNKRPNRPKIIVVTGLEGVELIISLLKLGVNGIVFKLDGYSEIVKTIEEIHRSGNYFQEKTLRIIQNNAHRWDKVPTVLLSFLENELLRALARGLTTKAIAGELRMTEATTETYRIRLIKKVGAPNTAALLAYAYRNGILG
jgi:DNA-binding NarL/FixJ family response regulator